MRQPDPPPTSGRAAQERRGSASTSGCASHEARRAARAARSSELERDAAAGLLPRASRSRAALLPLVTSDGYIIRVGFDTLLYMLLALGLNVVVGYAGLLDLGYVAFYGFGAYGYAMLASPKFGLHWRRSRRPGRVVATAMLGLPRRAPVAAARRRLPRDRDALLRPALRDRLQQRQPRSRSSASPASYDVTGGPNGIADIDPFTLFGARIASRCSGYFYVALSCFAGRASAPSTSSTGRAPAAPGGRCARTRSRPR